MKKMILIIIPLFIFSGVKMEVHDVQLGEQARLFRKNVAVEHSFGIFMTQFILFGKIDIFNARVHNCFQFF